ncbi:hypothetical protein [Burkholderia sp. Ac-20365]|uniref:hypothetical protein n=1 Tax=Burkholderia sp. Ac-20365 TaxID=2703897 RepID=UPI00197BA020|nr:hypothetical protein [Burkholderia sp. Ac-20365]MBN3761111.1 hypothetical protein [Burkholderia sp. Ac-20365]
MYEHHTLLSVMADLAFCCAWFRIYERVVPDSGVRRIGGATGMLLLLAGYVELSADILTRLIASRSFDAWAMPLDLFEKSGALAVVVGVGLLLVVNAGRRRCAAVAG